MLSIDEDRRLGGQTLPRTASEQRDSHGRLLTADKDNDLHYRERLDEPSSTNLHLLDQEYDHNRF